MSTKYPNLKNLTKYYNETVVRPLVSVTTNLSKTFWFWLAKTRCRSNPHRGGNPKFNFTLTKLRCCQRRYWQLRDFQRCSAEAASLWSCLFFSCSSNHWLAMKATTSSKRGCGGLELSSSWVSPLNRLAVLEFASSATQCLCMSW